jgi:hypothetical protein
MATFRKSTPVGRPDEVPGQLLLPVRQLTKSGRRRTTTPPRQLRVAGLFAGVGGIELGLARAGHEAQLLC